MCNHVFSYPMDTGENYNPDGKTLTGVCKCGAKQRSLGYRGVEPVYYDIMEDLHYKESLYNYIDNKNLLE